jgi:hypothetical protein
MKKEREYLCSACEWTGHGEAIIECPICHHELTDLTGVTAEAPPKQKPVKYNPQDLAKVEDEEKKEFLK